METGNADGGVEEVMPTAKIECGSMSSSSCPKGAESVSGGSTEDVSFLEFLTGSCRLSHLKLLVPM